MRTPGVLLSVLTLFILIFLFDVEEFYQRCTNYLFKLKHVIDVREKLNAYRSGKSRGSLKDYARALGDTPEDTGSKVAEWWKEEV